jgi:hypothetical protein
LNDSTRCAVEKILDCLERSNTGTEILAGGHRSIFGPFGIRVSIICAFLDLYSLAPGTDMVQNYTADNLETYPGWSFSGW